MVLCQWFAAALFTRGPLRSRVLHANPGAPSIGEYLFWGLGLFGGSTQLILVRLDVATDLIPMVGSAKSLAQAETSNEVLLATRKLAVVAA